MADRKKVLNGLKCCSKSIGKACPLECPYRVECLMQDDGSHMYSVMHDALKLLKEQQETIASLQGTICKLNAALAEQPEQKHGRWIDRDCGEWKCSACNDSWYLEVGDPEDNEMNYCPMCGAKMDEEVKQDGRNK